MEDIILWLHIRKLIHIFTNKYWLKDSIEWILKLKSPSYGKFYCLGYISLDQQNDLLFQMLTFLRGWQIAISQAITGIANNWD